jgi:8-oxo-dGTP pyrophosphatase MutT (NUDIX family)
MRQRASAVIIIKDDQILMVQVRDKDNLLWVLPGGTIELNETPEQALVRELREELTLNVVPRRQLYQIDMPYEPGVDFGFLVEPPVEPPQLGIDPAVVNWAWRSLDTPGDSWQVRQVKQALHR